MLFASFSVGEDSFAGADDGDAKTFEDLWKLLAFHGHAETWLTNPLEISDNALAVRAILKG